VQTHAGATRLPSTEIRFLHFLWPCNLDLRSFYLTHGRTRTNALHWLKWSSRGLRRRRRRGVGKLTHFEHKRTLINMYNTIFSLTCYNRGTQTGAGGWSPLPGPLTLTTDAILPRLSSTSVNIRKQMNCFTQHWLRIFSSATFECGVQMIGYVRLQVLTTGNHCRRPRRRKRRRQRQQGRQRLRTAGAGRRCVGMAPDVSPTVMDGGTAVSVSSTATLSGNYVYPDHTPSESESESECKCLTCNKKPTGSQFSLLHEPN